MFDVDVLGPGDGEVKVTDAGDGSGLDQTC